MLNLSIIDSNDISQMTFNSMISDFQVQGVGKHIEGQLRDFLVEDAYGLAQKNQNQNLLLACSDDKVVGYLHFWRKPFVESDFYSHDALTFKGEENYFAYEIEYLCVDIRFRKLRVGTRLIAYFLDNLFKTDSLALLVELLAVKVAVSFYGQFRFLTDFDDCSQPKATYMVLLNQ